MHASERRNRHKLAWRPAMLGGNSGVESPQFKVIRAVPPTIVPQRNYAHGQSTVRGQKVGRR